MNLKKVITLTGGALAANVGLFAGNILQAGPRVPDGRSMAEILGVNPEKATWEDVEKLLFGTSYPSAGAGGRPMRIFRACVDTGGGRKYARPSP